MKFSGGVDSLVRIKKKDLHVLFPIVAHKKLGDFLFVSSKHRFFFWFLDGAVDEKRFFQAQKRRIKWEVVELRPL